MDRGKQVNPLSQRKSAHSTIPNTSQNTRPAQKAFPSSNASTISEDVDFQPGKESSQQGAINQKNITSEPTSSSDNIPLPDRKNHPKRRSLLTRKPQGFSAEGVSAVTATGGVTAVPNTGNLQKVRVPLPGDTSNSGSANLTENPEVPSQPTPVTEKIPPALEKIHLPGVKAHTSRFRRVTTNKFSQLARPSNGKDTSLRDKETGKDSSITKAKRTGKNNFNWGRWARAGWVPAQEGAYAMALLPYWIGVLESSLRWIHWLVFALWICGYFAFNVGGIWLRSHRKDRYFKPLQIYGAITLILGIICLLLAPPLLEWAIVFFPLIIIAVTESVRHRERSLLARTSTIVATGVMTLVAYDIGTQFARSFAPISWLEHTATNNIDWAVSPTGNLQGWSWMLVVACIVTSYYWSTVPYVRSLVRKRGSQSFVAFSVACHAVLTAMVIGFFILGWVTWWHLFVWVLLFARSLAIPLLQKRSPQLVTVSRVGFTEIAVALLVLITLLV
ncbi:YwiC-like family protein [Varibaculum vaginae]|uniref:YwiC-like family protein n=1 Tax=Varibaculum vaginae TaxID=2364797 RepID=UPI0011C47970|nr:YwiC-like family protein [Varibaculum vaginae]